MSSETDAPETLAPDAVSPVDDAQAPRDDAKAVPDLKTQAPERAVYFDAWFPRQHCYHPSLPPRRLRMIEELVELKATMLVWSALGGGSISLPYLEKEAFGEIDERFRFYGFVNDSEFIRESQKCGIKVFGIVFEVQGWEFPVELNDAEDRILALNETRGIGRRDWIGLREFSQNRYPALWQSFETYFPGGLVNSDGDRVTDLLEECCSRDIHGAPCHARWVECPDREHFCYTMDRNNPVWREYLKAVIRIQIDAGVDGVQLDEAELPLTSLQYGGCFCKDCMKGFTSYLQDLPADRRPTELSEQELDGWHYGEWLLERGHDFKAGQQDTPLFWEYLRFQRRAITRYFGELAQYARAYATQRGRAVAVSGNFFNLFDHYYALEPSVDVIVTEMRNTAYRQPAWYRYAAGFAGPKPVVVVENPYGGVIPDLVGRLRTGRGHDLFRMSLCEAAALGANMSVPYGSWMGSVVQDSFYAPHDPCVEVQTFLADNEDLFARSTYSEVAVVYSIESNFQAMAVGDLFADNRLNVSEGEDVLFWSVCEELSGAAQPYDVVVFPDGDLRPDSLTLGDLARYRAVILPYCTFLTSHQARVLSEYLEGGGRIVALGPVGENLTEEERRRLVDHARLSAGAPEDTTALERLLDGFQVHVDSGADLALNVQRTPSGAALHIIRYDYDDERDEVPRLSRLELQIRLPDGFGEPAALSPWGPLAVEHTFIDQRHCVTLRDVPLYCVVLFHETGLKPSPEGVH